MGAREEKSYEHLQKGVFVRRIESFSVQGLMTNNVDIQ